MKTLLFFSFLGLGVGLFSCNINAQHQDTVDNAKTVNKEVKPVQSVASNFPVNAANGTMMEVELGKIAQDNASVLRVKTYGAMMVKDHTEADDNLKAIAISLNIVLPDSVNPFQPIRFLYW